MIYLLDLKKDDNGTWLMTSQSFLELTSFAESEADAPIKGVGALEEAIVARIDDGDAIPASATPNELKHWEAKRRNRVAVRLPLLSTLKINLYNTLKRQGVTRAELARRLGWHRESVDRLFRLDHNSRTDQIEAALAKLHQNVEVRVKEMAGSGRS